MYNLIKKMIYGINTVCFSLASVICIFAVIFRYIFNDSIVWAEEAVRFLFIIVFFLGASEACRLNKHIMMDLFVDRLPVKLQFVVKTLTDLMTISFLLFVAYLAAKNCIANMNQSSTALGIPYGILYMIIPIGCLFMSFFIGCNILERIRSRRKDIEDYTN